MLWHCAANLFNRLTNTLPNSEMRIDRSFLTFYPFYPKFFFRLSDAKFICCKLSSTNAIKEILFIADALLIFDCTRSETSIKTLISCILKDAKHGAANTSVFGSTTQFTVGIFYPYAEKYAPLFFGKRVLLFLAICLYGKVCLRTGNLRLRRITVHRDEVAGVPAQLPIVSLSLRSASDFNHFGEWHKMVRTIVPRHFTCSLGSFDHILKIPPFPIIQNCHQLARVPIWLTISGKLLNLL